MAQQQNDNVMRRYVRQCLHSRNGPRRPTIHCFIFFIFFFLYLSATRLMRSRDGHFCCVPSRGSEIKTELVFNPASVHYDTNMRIT